MRRFLRCFALLLGALAVGQGLGCGAGTGRPPTYPVTGTVTLKGKAVERATVVLVPTEKLGEAATGNTDSAGKFELTTYTAGDGAQAGDYKVKVLQFSGQKATVDEKRQYMSIEEEQKLSFAKDELPTPPAKNLLPKKYESEITSGLTHTVPKGPSTLEIKLD